MDAQEIKDLIASKIAGQGNQVDPGGKLAEILNALVDMASQGGGGDYILTLPNEYSFDTSTTFGDTFEQIAEELGVTVEQVQNLFTGKYFAVNVTFSIQGGLTASCFVPLILSHNSEGGNGCDYNFTSPTGEVIIDIECSNEGGVANMVLDIHPTN